MSRGNRLGEARNMIKEAYVSVCGVYCALRGPYRDRECLSRLKLEKWEIPRCARSRGRDYCFDCP